MATILCGACAAEHRNRSGKVGTVDVDDHGDLVWNGYATATWWPSRGNRTQERGIKSPRVLAGLAVDVPLPEQLPVRCRYHGAGSVATADLLTARGSMTVDFTATR